MSESLGFLFRALGSGYAWRIIQHLEKHPDVSAHAVAVGIKGNPGIVRDCLHTLKRNKVVVSSEEVSYVQGDKIAQKHPRRVTVWRLNGGNPHVPLLLKFLPPNLKRSTNNLEASSVLRVPALRESGSVPLSSASSPHGD